jgi:hypothetical protein
MKCHFWDSNRGPMIMYEDESVSLNRLPTLPETTLDPGLNGHL